MMKLSKFSLGSTAAIITSMGLIVGLSYAHASKGSIIVGLLIIAVADNISDSFSIHVYEESENSNRMEVLTTTLGNFFARLIIALSFVLLVALLPAKPVVLSASVWGLLLLVLISYYIARIKKSRPVVEILLHVIVAVSVIAASRYLGALIVGR